MASYFDVIGYAFDADTHCEACTRERFPQADAEFSDVEDSEGNSVHAIFDGQEQEPIVCGDCGAALNESAWEDARDRAFADDPDPYDDDPYDGEAEEYREDDTEALAMWENEGGR